MYPHSVHSPITEKLIKEIEKDTGFPFDVDHEGDDMVCVSVWEGEYLPGYYTWNTEDYK